MAEREATHPALRAARIKAFAALLLFTALVTAKVAAVRWLVVGGGQPMGIAFDALAVFGVLALVDLFFSDMRYRALIIADVVMSALLLAITLYHGYYSILPTREALGTLGQAGAVSTSIQRLLNPMQLLLFVDIPFLMLWGARALRRREDAVTGTASGRPASPGCRTPYVYQHRFVYMGAVIGLVVFAIVVNSARSVTQIDGYVISRQRGLGVYLAADIAGPKGAEAAAHQGGAQLQANIDGIKGGSSAKSVPGFTVGQAAGSNVIIIQVESLQGAAIGAKMGGVEVTPNLDRLIRESWYFPNHVSGIGRGTTADAEFVTATSFYPPYSGPAALVYTSHTLPSMPRLLTANGYTTETFHTNQIQFWNRSQLYPAIGWGKFYDASFFGSGDKIAFGASDRVLFEKTLPVLKEQLASGKPFCAQVITMSSHFPFTEIPANERTLKPVGPYVGTLEGDYLTEENYTDRQIGTFVDELRTSGILDKSILVIYGDHFGLPEPVNSKEQAALHELLGRDYTPMDRLNTPLIIRLPGQKTSHIVQTAVGQIDLMPTIADALGVDITTQPHFGRSMFSHSPVLFEAGGLLPMGSYVDSSTLYVAGDSFGNGTAWDVSTRQQLPIGSAQESKYQAIKSLLDLSDSYVRQLPIRPDYDPNAKAILPAGE